MLLLLCPRLKSLWANFLLLPLLLYCSCCSSRHCCCCSCCFCRIHHSTQQFCQKIKKPSSRKTVSKTWTMSTFFLCIISHQVHGEGYTDNSLFELMRGKRKKGRPCHGLHTRAPKMMVIYAITWCLYPRYSRTPLRLRRNLP